MGAKRQQTMAKVARERSVKEKRQRKLEKRQAKRLAAESGEPALDETLLPPDLNARYVDGGPPEPIADPSADLERGGPTGPV